jgi:hypothetical protein
VSRASDLRAVTEVIALAVRTHGRKRGWFEAARLLRVTERWVKSASYGEPIAAPDAIVIEQAALTLARARAAQLRAELNEIERGLANVDVLDAGVVAREARR